MMVAGPLKKDEKLYLKMVIFPTSFCYDTVTEMSWELGVQPYLYEPETNTEGNANNNITLLFYEITLLTERVESKF